MADVIRIDVDGAAVEAGRFEMHYQADPYPGGARYELSVADKELIEMISRRLKLPVGPPPSRTDTISVFNMLRLYMSLHGGRGAPLFWANNIETMSMEGGALRIGGVCSPHIDGRSLGDTKSDAGAAAPTGTEKTPVKAAGN